MVPLLLRHLLTVAPVATIPWWDTTVASDALVVVGFVVAGVIYGLTQHSGTQDKRRTTLNHLRVAKASMKTWSDSYFDTPYDDIAAADRAKLDRDKMLTKGEHIQNYLVPLAPLESLLEPPGNSVSLDPRTVEAAGRALQRMTVFNQLVQKQTDFHVLHLTEYTPHRTDDKLADAVEKISSQIHRAIGDRAWYTEIMAALDENIEELEKKLKETPKPELPKRRRPWQRRPKPPAIPPPQTSDRTDQK